jgi:hypothetical protein
MFVPVWVWFGGVPADTFVVRASVEGLWPHLVWR